MAAVAAFGLLMVGGGNRLGVLVAGGSEVTRLGPVSTRKAVMTLLSQLYDTPRREASPGPGADLVGTLQALERLQRRRGQVIVVSDFLDGGDWATPLRRLAIRHQIVAVQVVDPRELELPAVGMLAVVDTETGRQMHVQTNSARLRRRYADAARQRHDRIAGELLAARADHLVLATDGDWLIEIVRFFGRRRRAQRHATFGLPAAFAGAAAAEPQPPAGRRLDAGIVR